jgi:ATP-dependent DNA ligase
VHEVKHDGYWLIVRRDGEAVRLFTRREGEAVWSDRYPAIPRGSREAARQVVHPTLARAVIFPGLAGVSQWAIIGCGPHHR